MNDDMLELSMWRDGNIMHGNCIEDMNKLKEERDEARREVCELASRPYIKHAYEYAHERGWDCFQENNNG